MTGKFVPVPMIEDIVAVEPKGVISITGAGGKTSLMFHIARHLVRSGRKVLTTTTTKIFVPRTGQSETVIIDPDPVSVIAQARQKNAVHSTAASALMADVGKLKGFLPGAIRVFEDSELFDWIIVEADGAARKSLKAPASHEPVIPVNTTIHIAVSGLDGIGMDLNEENVFRSEIAGRIMKLSHGERITSSAVARLLSHPDGAFKNSPPQARRFVFLNKADDDECRESAVRVAADLNSLAPDNTDAVIVGQALDDVVVHAVHNRRGADLPVRSKISGIVLAAGTASRMGKTKQLLPYRGKTIVECVVDRALASKLDRVIVVTGHDSEAVERAIRDRNVTIVRNQEYASGQSSSLKAGIRAVTGDTDAVLFLLGDQPCIEPGTIDRILTAYNSSSANIIVPSYGGRRGNPVLFGRETFPAIEALSNDCGARLLFDDCTNRVIFLPVDDPGIHCDVDTDADYRKLLLYAESVEDEAVDSQKQGAVL